MRHQRLQAKLLRPSLPEGAWLLRKFLTLPEQKEIARICLELGAGPEGFYRPGQWSGGPPHHNMMCLGKNWNPRTGRYDAGRVQPIPAAFVALARRVARRAGMEIDADIALVNRYEARDKLGLHQDKDESPESIARGTPVVSVSLGDQAQFRFISSTIHDIVLCSGDVFVFGGPARMCYHGIRRILGGTGPAELKRMGVTGRLNITFRQY